jgi:surfeit locus 1 family protein
MAVDDFQKLRATGRFDTERQVLLENIIVNSRVGYYVLTPLRVDDAAPLLLVNRGWIAGDGSAPDPATIGVPGARLTVHGRVGSVPRAGYRMGEPISTVSGWPKLAVYPTLDELALALGEPVQPFVLLMDPEDDFGFLRQWTPEQIGPGRHYAYALQWFAMGIVLAGLLVWNYRKRGFEK